MVRERRVRTKRRIFFPNEGIYCLYWFEFDPKEGLGGEGEFNLIRSICFG
jgi:hypothetical protein